MTKLEDLSLVRIENAYKPVETREGIRPPRVDVGVVLDSDGEQIMSEILRLTVNEPKDEILIGRYLNPKNELENCTDYFNKNDSFVQIVEDGKLYAIAAAIFSDGWRGVINTGSSQHLGYFKDQNKLKTPAEFILAHASAVIRDVYKENAEYVRPFVFNPQGEMLSDMSKRLVELASDSKLSKISTEIMSTRIEIAYVIAESVLTNKPISYDPLKLGRLDGDYSRQVKK